MMTLAQAHALLPQSNLIGKAQTWIERVHSDTRSLQRGDLFVALKGERFDAHQFLAQAKAAGASAALAERGIAEAGLSGLQVGDSLHGLQQMAAAWRQRFELPLIAVTGSNGKTTVTQMIAEVLRAWHGDGALATAGNFNNHIGVPLTLLRLRQDDRLWHRAAVVELGMNHPGEIDRLARIAAPTIALVNNAQREHQEFMVSVESVARENGAVIQALGPTGVAVFPADDDHALLWRQLAAPRPQLTFSLRGQADVVGAAVWIDDHWMLRAQTPGGPVEFALHAAGLHNVRNALAAVACALAAGAPMETIVRGLEAFAPVAGRSQVRGVVFDGRAVTLVDDSYNANPDSVRAAIDLLAALPGPHWLVLGDMGEVGARGPEFHAEMGAYARARGIEAMWSAGEQCAFAAAAYGASARHFTAVEELIAALPARPSHSSALVKGSRFMKMERVVAALCADGGARHAV